MEYFLALILAGLAALLVAVLRSSRPHPRHDFLLQMVARLAPGDVVSPVSGDRGASHAAMEAQRGSWQ